MADSFYTADLLGSLPDAALPVLTSDKGNYRKPALPGGAHVTTPELEVSGPPVVHQRAVAEQYAVPSEVLQPSPARAAHRAGDAVIGHQPLEELVGTTIRRENRSRTKATQSHPYDRVQVKGCKRAPLDYNVKPMPWPRVASDHAYAKSNAALAEFRKASEKLSRTIASVKTPSRIETVYLKGEELWSGAEPGWYRG